MHLISIDPHVLSKQFPDGRNIAIAEFKGTPPQFFGVAMVSYKKLLDGDLPILTDDLLKHLVIEGVYSGDNKKYGLDLARLCGRIEQYFINLGFKTHLAPVFGTASWQAQSLGWRGGVPSRKQAKVLSIAAAKSDHPHIEWDEHKADAYNIGRWWLRHE